MSHEIVQIKPIVLFGISEHYKRKTIQLNSKDFLLLGCIYGIREGLVLNFNFSAPLRVTDDNKENKIDKEVFLRYFDAQDKLIRIDHPGNNLRNLQLVGLYVVRKNLQITKQDQQLFLWLKDKGFENQRLMMINFEGKHQIHVYKRQDKIIQVPYTNAIESSETICIQGLANKSKESPYLKTLEANRNLMLNYTQKLKDIRNQLKHMENPQKLRELNTVLNSLRHLTEEKTVLQSLNSAVMFNFSVAMHLEKKELL